MSTNVYIAVTRGNDRVIITGEMDLLLRILETFNEKPDFANLAPSPALAPKTDNALTFQLQPR
jgi:hypothetical protein